MIAVDPPLLLQRQVFLKIEQQVGRGHGPPGKEVRSHPAAVEVVGGAFVAEVVHEEFSAGFEKGVDFGEEELVVFHVFEEFDTQYSVERAF